MYGKEHYQKIAKILREARVRALGSNYTYLDKDELVEQFVQMFRMDNPRFDETKFKKEIDK
jgi:hypothetical protein